MLESIIIETGITMKKNSHFPKLHRKIFLTVFLIPSVFTCVVSLATAISTNILYRQSFDTNFVNQMSLLSSRFEIGYSQWDAQATALSSNTSFQKSCEEKDETVIARNLRDLTISNSSFLGCLYYYNNNAITSADVSGAPKFQDLLSLPEFQAFYQSEKGSFVFIRNDVISSAYFTTPYKNEQGLLSLFHKVKNESNQLLGVLEIDIKTNDIYDKYLSIDNIHYMDESHIYLSYGEHTLINPSEKEVEIPILEEEQEVPISYHSDYLMKRTFHDSVMKENLSDFSLLVFVSKGAIQGTLLGIDFGILAADILFLLLFLFIARKAADKDCNRLDAISDEIAKEKHSEEES